ncbi:putative F-box protein At1g49610 isoform X1 [Carex rostrata]
MRDIDWISGLPDSLQVHILSYLPTKLAVQTSVLSKPWKKVWASVPVLEFDFADFWSEDIFSFPRPGTFINDNPECHEKFVSLIDAVLASRQGQPIDRFTLVWQYQVKNYCNQGHPVRRWITHVLQHNPRVLSIYVQPNFARVEVPDMVFSCSSLEEMKLQVDQEDRSEVLEPNLVNLPNLKRLNLGYFTITIDFMDMLLLGCPKLEELELYACAVHVSRISCTTTNLKSLVFDGCCIFPTIWVSIPSLQYLKVTIVSSQLAGFVFENMSSLVKASVSFFTDARFETRFYKSKSKIMKGLSRVKNLDVVLHGSEAEGMLRHALKNCPDFEDLKTVHFENFDGSQISCLDMIDPLVQLSPNLEKLSFYHCKDGSDEFELLKLREVVSEHGNCQLIESKEGHIYESLDELQKLLFRYVERFQIMLGELVVSELEEYDDDNGGDDDEDSDVGVGGDDVEGEVWSSEGEGCECEAE